MIMERFKINTKIFKDGKIIQEMLNEFTGNKTRNVLDTKEKATREALVALGWNSPPTREGMSQEDNSVPIEGPPAGFPTRYIDKHVWAWEEEYGPVPRGYAVCFKDGDITNVEIDNLTVLSSEESQWLDKNNYSENSYPDLRKMLRAIARSTCMINKTIRKGQG
jgi:hypothetical protein